MNEPLAIQQNIPLAPYTTYKIGGPAQFFIRLSSLEELFLAVDWAKERELPLRILGGGSNLLISDKGVNGLVIALTAHGPVFSEAGVKVGAGYGLSKLVSDCVARGLQGLEWAAGIPGQVGGAVRGNAGAFGGWIANNINIVEVYNTQTNKLEIFNKADCHFGYRDSLFKKRPELLIWSVSFSLISTDRASLESITEDHRRYRREHHPTFPSAGCVFKNVPVDEVAEQAPELWSAAQLARAVNGQEVAAGFIIAQANLAGYAVGPMQVSTQHSNFLINRGGATAQEAHQLISYIQRTIKQRYHLELIPELAFWE